MLKFLVVLIHRKLFPFDKNYILKEAQAASREVLLLRMMDIVKEAYHQLHNPLGLQDDTTRKIHQYHLRNTERFQEFYDIMAGIYRFRHGDNQLAFMWDGRTHLEVYQEEWGQVFQDWIRTLCLQPNFLKAVLELTVYYPKKRPELAEGRMKNFMAQHFELKLHKRRGILSQTA
ncbi:MAG TPA: hypothetical protein DCE41_27625 [Cytophagales bacterium]|nr:hypothetical protein [Cytophagales bacterium]HAA20993.1 hypothetical protein [Cytophagales bacterium]HAP61526.1 hypothetical protein [Cytophagales bacterium]